MAENTNTEREAFVQWMISDVLRSATKPVSDEMHRALRQTAERVWDSGEELVVRGWQARASLSLPAAGQESVAPDWWRKRADEIELEVARTGSTEAMRCFTDMRTLLQAVAAAPQPAVAAGWPLIARALDEWHEDDGPVMWWAWNGNASGWAGEPAWCGTPLSSDWPGYHTHWTPHPTFPPAPSTEGEARGTQ